MQKLFIALSILTLSSGCAFEVHSVGTGNGGLEGDGAGGSTGLDARFSAVSPETADEDAGVETPALDEVLDGPALDDVVKPSDPVDVVVAPRACTPSTQAHDCPGTSCDPATLQCSTFKLASRPRCWTCVSDSDCGEPDHRCVEMDYNGDRFPDELTGFCMRVAQFVPEYEAGGYELEDDCEEPFETLLVDRPSLSGGSLDSYCGIREDLTTCYALRSFQNQEACPGGRDDECPDGGICRRFGTGSKGVYCCTFECTEDDECPAPDGAEASCGGYCGG